MILSVYKECFNKTSCLPKKTSPFKTNIENLFKKKVNSTATEYTDECISLLLKHFKKAVADVDLDLFYDYISLRAQEEKEANANSIGAIKNIEGINSKADLDLEVELYDIMSKCALRAKAQNSNR